VIKEGGLDFSVEEIGAGHVRTGEHSARYRFPEHGACGGKQKAVCLSVLGQGIQIVAGSRGTASSISSCGLYFSGSLLSTMVPPFLGVLEDRGTLRSASCCLPTNSHVWHCKTRPRYSFGAPAFI
jgi:hypothetical protein